MHRVSSFYGEAGKSIEATFNVPLCEACQASMRSRERVAYATAFLAFALGATGAWGKGNSTDWLNILSIVVLTLGFLGFLVIGIGRPFEPARYVQGRIRFHNPKYQQLFDESNAQASRTGQAG